MFVQAAFLLLIRGFALVRAELWIDDFGEGQFSRGTVMAMSSAAIGIVEAPSAYAFVSKISGLPSMICNASLASAIIRAVGSRAVEQVAFAALLVDERLGVKTVDGSFVEDLRRQLVEAGRVRALLGAVDTGKGCGESGEIPTWYWRDLAQ